LRILSAASRHSPVGEEPLGSRLFCSRTVERNPCLRDLTGQRGMIVRIREARFETTERLTSADVCSDRHKRGRDESSGGRCRHRRFSSGERLDLRRYADR